MSVYRRWDQVPANLKTKNLLHKAGLRLRPGQQPIAFKAGMHGDLYKLYDAGECLPARPQTAKQMQSLAKAKQAQRDLRTCPRCGAPSWYSDRRGYSHLGTGLCETCIELESIDADRDEAITWARMTLDSTSDNVLILDSETTGLTGEILDLAIVDLAGRTVFQSYFYPRLPIEPGAQRIHGLTLTRLAYAPYWRDWWPEVRKILRRARQIVIYNASFDLSRITTSCEVHHVEPDDRLSAFCAMEWYAEYCGHWSRYHGSYTWQKLPGGDHTALGDARATLKLIRDVASARKQGEHNGSD